jgi:PAS domain-containing protein
MRKQSYSENAPNLPPSEVKKEPPLSNRRNLSLPPNPLEEGSDAIEFLKSAKKLTAEDVVVMYAYAEAIVETVREPLIILDRDLRIKTANKSFFDTFQITKQNTYDRYFFDLGNGQWDIPDLKRLLKKILPKNSKFNEPYRQKNHDFKCKADHIGGV